ncbi:hypothetical protein ARMGADRAFT_338931 [Armillaria gallica]|uniref:Uncharacterized protein n=1 Tax=Armillaria gallica TaxID=47427 RepID=A0A2H3DEL2_ARMGA|nr:hypothetical protein ARMGADRAFT_338931 [Armillaria gallica]
MFGNNGLFGTPVPRLSLSIVLDFCIPSISLILRDAASWYDYLGSIEMFFHLGRFCVRWNAKITRLQSSIFLRSKCSAVDLDNQIVHPTISSSSDGFTLWPCISYSFWRQECAPFKLKISEIEAPRRAQPHSAMDLDVPALRPLEIPSCSATSSTAQFRVQILPHSSSNSLRPKPRGERNHALQWTPTTRLFTCWNSLRVLTRLHTAFSRYLVLILASKICPIQGQNFRGRSPAASDITYCLGPRRLSGEE